MQNAPEFVAVFAKEAQTLLKRVKDPLFSRGTYQFEIKEPKKETAFPFLQVSDEGKVGDAFCTCKVSESGKGCPHLAAAYLKVFEQEQPLHVRFQQSLWNALFQMAARRDCPLKKEDGKYIAESKTKKLLFSIEGKTLAAKKKLDQIIEKREIETEETSIKFFNLSAEELTQYRAGEPSFQLKYELSCWSDLAKWLFFLDHEEIVFGSGLPQEITLKCPEVEVWFYVSEVNWPGIIPTLKKGPLKVFDEEEEGSVRYDPATKTLHVERGGGTNVEGIPLGDWLFVEGKGFYRRKLDSSGVIPADKIAEVLSSKVLSRYLPIPDPIPARYKLWFDSEANLHVELDLKGDLFPPFAHVDGNGFIQFSDLMFQEKEKVIPKADVPEFVSKHRLWLHNFPGFQTHLGSLEAHLTYYLTEDGLVFDAELNFPEQFDETIDFQEWVYIKGSGFYMKKENRGRLPLHPGLRLKKEEISSFLSSHKEDLEQVQGFFLSEPIVLRMGLALDLDEEGQIFIQPKIEYVPGIKPADVQLFGDFAYLKDKGFSELPLASRLPERYRTPTTIPTSQESAFLAYELDPLKPYILELNPHLKRPTDLKLKIRKIQRDRKKRTGEWLVDLMYESELGSVDVFTIYDAFHNRKKHLFSNAGLLALKESRFNWLRGLSKRRLDRKKGMIRINTLEWIRLSVFEDIQEPRGHDPESVETRQLLEELQKFETHRLLDISRLKSTLRPYQETGLQWLWFLYCHGLSGLLCDDMGLGKTHQAMALLAAVAHEDHERANKYLVVCPTSVIYHWQELLRKFLPDLRVCTYYGLERSLDQFEEHFDLLLTSYGILRTGRENLRTHMFEVAFFDEIQIAKNSASQTHKALRDINAKMRLGLSGTPIENRIRELKSLLDIVLPGYLPPEGVFRELFINPIEKEQDESKKKLLSKLIKPFILRRKKSEVLFDLPEKIEEIAYCDLSPEQKELYVETARNLKNTVFSELKDSARPVSYVHVFSALSRLKQICDHPCLITGDLKKYYEHESGKWDLFVELLYEARDSGQKVVIFSQYLDMLAIIEQYLKKKGIGFATIKGSTRDRAEQLRKFREDPTCEVFTASLLAAGVGIDLTVASIVIHYDRWWNPAKENQATDRVHRIGQNRGVQVFKLVTKHTIEEHIHELIERKKGLLEDIIGKDEVDTINYLSRDELIQVFETIFKEVE